MTAATSARRLCAAMCGQTGCKQQKYMESIAKLWADTKNTQQKYRRRKMNSGIEAFADHVHAIATGIKNPSDKTKQAIEKFERLYKERWAKQ